MGQRVLCCELFGGRWRSEARQIIRTSSGDLQITPPLPRQTIAESKAQPGWDTTFKAPILALHSTQGAYGRAIQWYIHWPYSHQLKTRTGFCKGKELAL